MNTNDYIQLHRHLDCWPNSLSAYHECEGDIGPPVFGIFNIGVGPVTVTPLSPWADMNTDKETSDICTDYFRDNYPDYLEPCPAGCSCVEEDD